MPEPEREVRFGPFRLDPSQRRLERDGRAVQLTGKAFDALVLLARNRGRPVTREELTASLWEGAIVEESNLTQAISVARRALGDQGNPRRYIATISGRATSSSRLSSRERLQRLRLAGQ